MDGIAAIIGIVGGIFGFIGWLISKASCKKNNEKFKNIESLIHDIEVENAQFAKVINNYGLTYKETKDIAGDVYDEKVKNMPGIYFQDKPPANVAPNSIWISPVNKEE